MLCSRLPAPAIRGGGREGAGALGAVSGPSWLPRPPTAARPDSCSRHSAPFKVRLCCAVRGLDVCLVPDMHSYHYPRLLTIAAPRLCYICGSLPRGRDTTLRLISPLLHSAPCLSAPRSYSSSSSFFPPLHRLRLNLTSEDLGNLLPLKAALTPPPAPVVTPHGNDGADGGK